MPAQQRLTEKYRLVRKVATTATAEVYLASRAGADGKPEQVLVKRALSGKSPDIARRFSDETRIAASLGHPNIIKVHEIGADDGVRYMVLEHVQGQSLPRVLEAATKKAGRLPLEVALGIVRDLARALHYAHERTDSVIWPRGIVHGAVCPQNVLVGFDGLARLQDFGAVSPAEQTNDIDPASFAARLPYTSPERLAGASLEKASDLFALGVLLYELTTGRPAFVGTTTMEVTLRVMECSPDKPSAVWPGYPPKLEAVVLQAMARVPAQRIRSGLDLGTALEDFMHVAAMSVSPSEIGTCIRQLVGAGAAVKSAEPEGDGFGPLVVGTIAESAKPVAAKPASSKPAPWKPDPVEAAPAPPAKPATAKKGAIKTEEIVLDEPAPAAAPAPVAGAPASGAMAAIAEELAAARRQAEAAKAELADARREAEQAARELDLTKREVAAARTETQAARRLGEAAQAEVQVAARKADAARLEAEGARRQTEAARSELESVRRTIAAAEEAAKVAREREATARKDSEAAARREAEAIFAAETARHDLESARRLIEAGKSQAEEIRTELSSTHEELKQREMRAKEEAAAAVIRAARAEEETKEARAAAEKASRERAEALAAAEIAAKDAKSAREEKESAEWAARTLRDASRKSVEEAEAKAAAALAEAESAKQQLADATVRERAAKKEAAEASSRAMIAQRQFEANKREQEPAKAGVEATRKELEALAAKFAEAQAELEIARHAVTGAEAARVAAEAAQAAAEKAKADAEAEKAAAEAAKITAEAATAAAEQAKAVAEQEKAAAEMAMAAAQQATAVAEKARAVAEEAKSVAEAAQTISEQAAKTGAEGALAAAKAAAATAEAAAAKAEAARLTAVAETQAALKEVLAAKGELAAARKDADGLRKALATMQGELDAAHAEASEASAKSAEAEDAIAEVKAARAAADVARKDAFVARSESDVVRKEMIAARAEVEALRRELAEEREKAQALKRGASIVTSVTVATQPGVPVPPYSNLPSDSDLVPFVGREVELKALARLLGETPVIAVCGPDGIGRTRFTREVGRRHLTARTPTGGVWAVDLAGVRDVEGVCGAIATVLELPLGARMKEAEMVEHLGAELAARGSSLILLDGIDASLAKGLREVLERWTPATDTTFIVVSSKPVGVRDERVLDLEPLATDGDASTLLANLATARREKKPNDAALAAIAKIAQLLEGNPLAIELAAARTDLFTPAKLLASLTQHERPSGSAVVAWVLEWSWRLLTPGEQAVFARIAVFAGPFSRAAADEVVGSAEKEASATPSELLSSLVAQGLLRAVGDRFDLHPAVRQFAEAKLAASGAAGGAATKQAVWAARSAAGGAASVAELQAAIDRALSIDPPTATSSTSALRASTALAALPVVETYGPRGRVLAGLDAALAAAKRAGADARVQAEAMAARGRLRRVVGRIDDGLNDLYDAHDLASRGKDRGFEARILAEIGLTLREKGKADKATRALEQALAMARAGKDAALETLVQSYLKTS